MSPQQARERQLPLDVQTLAAGPRILVWLTFACGCEREATVPKSVWMTEIVPARCPECRRPVVSMVRSEGA